MFTLREVSVVHLCLDAAGLGVKTREQVVNYAGSDLPFE